MPALIVLGVIGLLTLLFGLANGDPSQQSVGGLLLLVDFGCALAGY